MRRIVSWSFRSARLEPSSDAQGSVHPLLSLLVLLAVLFATTAGAAKLCGDDVDGRRVACDCGDILVSDLRLQTSDPIANRPCPVDGLIVRASERAERIELNLAGVALHGSGTGAGIRVERGGSEGAAILGGDGKQRGSIVGFGTGIATERPTSLRRIERVTVRASRRDGLLLRSRGAVILDVEAIDNGRDGVRLSGKGGRVVGIVARRNGDSGVRAVGSSTIVSGRMEDNRNHGLVAEGGGMQVHDVTTRGNGGRGLLVRGLSSSVRDTVSESNLLPDQQPGQPSDREAGT